tara:strand:+ start:487 stop:744 length:258 start_codon:yes stop_codon:yes gene_type:complete
LEKIVDRNELNYHYLDLRGIGCPINFVKCCLALENLPINEVLRVDLDIGEAENTVMDGLKDKGYKVNIQKKDLQIISLLISSEKK